MVMPRSVAGRRSCHPGVSVSRLLALRPTPGNLRRRFALVAETAPPTPVDHARGTTQDYERDHKIEPDHHYLLSESPSVRRICGDRLVRTRMEGPLGACRHGTPLPGHRSGGAIYDLRRRRTSGFKRRPVSRHTPETKAAW